MSTNFEYKEFLENYKDDLEDAIENGDDIGDLIYEIADREADVYYSEIGKWYAEDINRYDYVDKAVQTFGLDTNSNEFRIFDLLTLGQIYYLENLIREYVERYLKETGREDLL